MAYTSSTFHNHVTAGQTPQARNSGDQYSAKSTCGSFAAIGHGFDDDTASSFFLQREKAAGNSVAGFLGTEGTLKLIAYNQNHDEIVFDL